MDWLESYTFPRERLHADAALAGAEYAQLLHRLVTNGTTCALFFGSLHLEACKALAETAVKVSKKDTKLCMQPPIELCKL